MTRSLRALAIVWSVLFSAPSAWAGPVEVLDLDQSVSAFLDDRTGAGAAEGAGYNFPIPVPGPRGGVPEPGWIRHAGAMLGLLTLFARQRRPAR